MKNFKTEWWAEYALDCFETGSRYVCDPPVMTTDDDYILLIDVGVLKPFEARLHKENWRVGGSLIGKPDGLDDLRERGYDRTRIFRHPDGLRDYFYWPQRPNDRHPDPEHEFIEDEMFPPPVPKDVSGLPTLEEFPKDKETNVFRSWKKDDTNLILTCSTEYFDDFFKATKLSKFLNLLQKEDRVALFQAICQNNWSFPVKQKGYSYKVTAIPNPMEWQAPVQNVEANQWPGVLPIQVNQVVAGQGLWAEPAPPPEPAQWRDWDNQLIQNAEANPMVGGPRWVQVQPFGNQVWNNAGVNFNNQVQPII